MTKPRQRSGRCPLPGSRRKTPDKGMALQQGGGQHTSVCHRKFAVTPKDGASGPLSLICPRGGVGFDVTAPQSPQLLLELPLGMQSLAHVISLSHPVPTYLSETPNWCQGNLFWAIIKVCLFSQAIVHDGNSSKKQTNKKINCVPCVILI